jgi:hypothetical protein
VSAIISAEMSRNVFFISYIFTISAAKIVKNERTTIDACTFFFEKTQISELFCGIWHFFCQFQEKAVNLHV